MTQVSTHLNITSNYINDHHYCTLHKTKNQYRLVCLILGVEIFMKELDWSTIFPA